MYFDYGEKETDYLRKKDKKLGEVIESVGHINRSTDHDLFSSVVHQIIGQQISTKAQTTIWGRMQTDLGVVDADAICTVDADRLQSFGITFRKADYIKDFAEKVKDGSFDLDGIWEKSDAGAIRELTSLRGVGVWTAEMILLFCMERPDILSYDDLAIRRGLCILYRHRKIDRPLFEKYRRRYRPYGSVASLYLWEVAGKTMR